MRFNDGNDRENREPQNLLADFCCIEHLSCTHFSQVLSNQPVRVVNVCVCIWMCVAFTALHPVWFWCMFFFYFLYSLFISHHRIIRFSWCLNIYGMNAVMFFVQIVDFDTMKHWHLTEEAMKKKLTHTYQIHIEE